MYDKTTRNADGNAPTNEARRGVLKTAAGAGLLIALPMLTSGRAKAAGLDQWTVAGKVGDFVTGQPKRIQLQNFVFFVTRTSATDLKAVWAKCTHKGCMVDWLADAKQLI